MATGKAKPAKKDDGWFWWVIILAFLAAAGGGGGVVVNNRQDDAPDHKPVPHSTISPEGVKPLPKEK